MKSSKGQGIIIEVLAFSMSVMLAMIVFIVLIYTGGVQEHSVSESVEYELGEIRKRSTISLTMNDKIWRAPEVDKGKYEGWPAYKVMSYYLSTPGDQFYVKEDSIDTDTVEEDLEDYLEYKMEKYWTDGPSNVDYYLNVSYEEANQRPTNLTVSNYVPSGRYSRVSYPLSLYNGQSAEITLWTNTSQNIYAVGGTD